MFDLFLLFFQDLIKRLINNKRFEMKVTATFTKTLGPSIPKQNDEPMTFVFKKTQEP